MYIRVVHCSPSLYAKKVTNYCVSCCCMYGHASMEGVHPQKWVWPFTNGVDPSQWTFQVGVALLFASGVISFKLASEPVIIRKLSDATPCCFSEAICIENFSTARLILSVIRSCFRYILRGIVECWPHPILLVEMGILLSFGVDASNYTLRELHIVWIWLECLVAQVQCSYIS